MSFRVWNLLSVFLAIAIATVLVGCGEDDPEPDGDADADSDADADADTDGDTDADADTDSDTDADSDTDSDSDSDADSDGDSDCNPGPACEPADDDYLPREGDPDDSPYADCVADDGEYHAFNPESVSTIARVAAFETIADLLWRGDTPTIGDFTDALTEYSTAEGLESRVSRREDEHYPPVEIDGETVQCRDLTPDQQTENAERCVGPALIQPILNDAFDAGLGGEDPEINAARIEAALLWFLYVSAHKELSTCVGSQGDCDSGWAYFTGGHQRDETQLGLAAYVQALEAETFDRAFDGVLAVDCWDDLDPPTGDPPARGNLELRELAMAQLDRGLLRGVALLVIDRLETLAAAGGVERDAAWAFIEILGPVLDREAGVRDGAAAGRLAASWAAGPDAIDVAASICDLETVFHCP